MEPVHWCRKGTAAFTYETGVFGSSLSTSQSLSITKASTSALQRPLLAASLAERRNLKRPVGSVTCSHRVNYYYHCHEHQRHHHRYISAKFSITKFDTNFITISTTIIETNNTSISTTIIDTSNSGVA